MTSEFYFWTKIFLLFLNFLSNNFKLKNSFSTRVIISVTTFHTTSTTSSPLYLPNIPSNAILLFPSVTFNFTLYYLLLLFSFLVISYILSLSPSLLICPFFFFCAILKSNSTLLPWPELTLWLVFQNPFLKLSLTVLFSHPSPLTNLYQIINNQLSSKGILLPAFPIRKETLYNRPKLLPFEGHAQFCTCS